MMKWTMRPLVMVAAAIGLTGCATTGKYATCENARAAVEAARVATEAICPAPLN